VRSYEVIIGGFIVKLCRLGWSSPDQPVCLWDTLASAQRMNQLESLDFWPARPKNPQLFAVFPFPAQALRFNARHALSGARLHFDSECSDPRGHFWRKGKCESQPRVF
jgi:hypothetical protein